MFSTMFLMTKINLLNTDLSNKPNNIAVIIFANFINFFSCN